MAVAILSTLVLATASTFGARIPRAHPAASTLQAALVDARVLAARTGSITNSVVPTGATVTVGIDPSDRSGFGSIIKVYRSRPIPFVSPDGVGRPTPPNALTQDIGFPTARVGATFRITERLKDATERPFTILISTSGYASILRNYLYDPVSNNYYSGTDPGCTDGGVTIAADDGMPVDMVSAPFSCRGAVLQMKAPAYAS